MNDKQRRRFLLTGVALIASPSISPAGRAYASSDTGVEQRLQLYGNEARWSIHRKGRRIGTHRMSAERSNGAIDVFFDTDITVTVLKVPVYRFMYASQERWVDDRLMTVDTRVTEKGDTTRTTLDVRAEPGEASGPEGRSSVSDLRFATNHWHNGVLAETQVFNTITGMANRVRITEIGRKELVTDSGTLPYTAYRYEGELELVSWYDDSGRWLGMQFVGEDGSTIEYRWLP